MNLRLLPMASYGIPESLEVLNLGFSDYLVPIQMDLPHFYDMLRTTQVDVNLSQVVLKDHKALGIALIARRGWSSRLAGMAIVPDERGRKTGHWLMGHLVDQAKNRSDQYLVLEVIEQNEPAVKLYQKLGFRIMRRLLGFRLVNPIGEKTELTEIDIRDFANQINLFGLPDLPWQLSGESLAAYGPPHRAFCLGSAYAGITDPGVETVVLRSLLTLPEARGTGQASALLRALFSRFPDKNWVIPAIFPEDMAGFFEKMGFERQKLSQFQMELPLN